MKNWCFNIYYVFLVIYFNFEIIVEVECYIIGIIIIIRYN